MRKLLLNNFKEIILFIFKKNGILTPVLMFILGFFTSLQAHGFGYVPNAYQNWVASTLNSTPYRKSILNQIDNKPVLRNSCGAMSALIVYNHATGGNPGFTTSHSDVTKAIKRLYNFVGKQTNEYISVYDIRDIMKKRWKWTDNTKVRSTKAGYNYEQMKDDLNSNRPVITVMKPGGIFEPVSPDGKRAGIEHLIVIMYADNNIIFYVDPWNGKVKSASKTEFLNYWINTKASVVGKPN